MKNKYNLSKYNVAFLTYDNYDKHEDFISATTLLKPTREILINRLCDGKKYADVSDYIASRIGTGVHELRENTPFEDYIMREERMFCSIEHLGVKEFGISGKPDLIDLDYNQPQIETNDGLLVIEDLKVTSILKLKYGDFQDYVLQLSILKYIALRDKNLKSILTKKGIEQDDKSFSEYGVISMIFKDWSNKNSYLSPIPIKEIPLKLLKDDEIETRIKDKTLELQKYWMIENQEELPECSDKIKQKFNGKMCEKYCSARFHCNKSPVFIGETEAD